MAALALTAVSAVATGCLGEPRHRETREVSVEHVTGSPLHVHTRNGSIDIATHDGADVRIVAKLSSNDKARLEEAHIVTERGLESELLVDIEWPASWCNHDAGSFEILVPDARGVRADASNGSIRVAGLAGRLEPDTHNGALRITNPDGPVAADTSNSAIIIDGVSGAVEADTSNGRVEVALTEANAGPVELETSNGRVSLTIGSAFTGTVSARISNGGMTFGPFDERYDVRFGDMGKNEGEAVFGSSPTPVSTLKTSNGRITVKNRR